MSSMHFDSEEEARVWKQYRNGKGPAELEPLTAPPPHGDARHQKLTAQPPLGAMQSAAATSMDDVADRLRERIADGISRTDLNALCVELAGEADQVPITIQRIAESIEAEQIQAAGVATEAAAIAAEADRQEIGSALTAHYLLPTPIAAAIEARARYLPCDGPSAVLPFLAAVAGLVKLGTQVEASAVAGYRVPINLFGCLVGRSGAKKSPVGRLLLEAPTQALRSEMAASFQAELADWRELCRAIKRGDSKPDMPQPRRLVVSDYTGEALAAQLQIQEATGLGLLIYRDELKGMFSSLDQYRNGKGSDEQQLLELFDGGGLTSIRIVGDRHYTRSQVSIWGSTQPDNLRKLVADGDASGLWARFLFVPLPERAVRLPLSTTPREVGEVEMAAQSLAEVCGMVYRLSPMTYKLSAAAAEQFAHYEETRQRAALSAAIGAQSALFGKSPGKVLRIGGLLHLVQIAAGEITRGEPITPATIERATALVDYLDGWALSLHAEVATGGIGQLMRTVHRIATASGRPIRWGDLQGQLSSKQRKKIDAAAVTAAMQALAAAGYGEVETGARGATSYRATSALP